MSQRVLMNSVRDHLRQPVGDGEATDGLGFEDAQCECTLEGEPLPSSGEYFVGIHEGPWSNTDEHQGRNDSISVYVTVTRRCTFAPKDRRRVPLLDAADAVDVLADKIASKIHGNYSIIGDPNDLGSSLPHSANVVLGSSVNGFIRPLYFKGPTGPSTPKGPEWFSAAPITGEGVDPAIGIARTFLFSSDETRYQTMTSQT